MGRYHSLFALFDRLPEELKVTALSHDDVIMAIEHKTLPIAAVQFHPESIMTLAGEVGLAIITNVISRYAKPGNSSTMLQEEMTVRETVDGHSPVHVNADFSTVLS